jgi:hypothetical protein
MQSLIELFFLATDWRIGHNAIVSGPPLRCEGVLFPGLMGESFFGTQVAWKSRPDAP